MMANRLAAIRAVLVLPCPPGVDPIAWRRAQEAASVAPAARLIEPVREDGPRDFIDLIP